MTHARRLDTPLETYVAPDGRTISLVPISTLRQARVFLVRWLWLYRLCRVAEHLVAVRRAEGLVSARAEGQKIGVFVD